MIKIHFLEEKKAIYYYFIFTFFQTKVIPI